MVAGDDGAEEKEFWGESLFRIVIPLPNVPQSTVLGHCLAAGLASGSQLEVLQVTAPGVPDLPAATPHFVAHPRGSACFQLPNSVCVWVLNNLSTKHLEKRPSVYCGLCGIKMMMGANSNDRVSKHAMVDWWRVCDGCG